MRTESADVLEDPTYAMPAIPPATNGVAWLRGAVVRFADGDVHRRRRALVERCLDEIGPLVPHDTPTRSLLVALGMPIDLEDDLDAVAGGYQPHFPRSSAADRAADRLVEACGGRTEASAAIVCVLVQAHAATAAMIDERRAGSDAPPVPFTRRIAPDGEEVMVDLGDAHFGRGPHRCPGEALARQLVDAAVQLSRREPGAT